MRNKYPGVCYRCGHIVEKGAGHFERHKGGWRTQHAECAIKHREEKFNKQRKTMATHLFVYGKRSPLSLAKEPCRDIFDPTPAGERYAREQGVPACCDEYRNKLEDVINELDLSDAVIADHGQLGTPPAELVRMVLQQKDATIRNLRAGMVDLSKPNASLGIPGGEPGYAPGCCSAFNALPADQKWVQWKSESGTWTCKHCGTVLSDGPSRARPFRGSSVCCDECDGELTRRTGGGQNDPFNWVLLPNVPLQSSPEAQRKGIP